MEEIIGEMMERKVRTCFYMLLEGNVTFMPRLCNASHFLKMRMTVRFKEKNTPKLYYVIIK